MNIPSKDRNATGTFRKSFTTVVKRLGPLLVYAAYIFAAGSSKDSDPPPGMSDKAAHFIAFGLMVPLAVFALGYLLPRLSFLARVAIGVIVSSSLGALLEFWQLFLPWRTCDVLDWAADTIGALAAALVTLPFRKLFERFEVARAPDSSESS